MTTTKSFCTGICTRRMLVLILIFSFTTCLGQKNDFWKHVQFGGAFALSLGNSYTEITIAPGAIYNFNPYFALGTGLQYTYISSKSNFDSSVYGVNFIALFTPIPQIQLSTEIEELHVHNSETISPGLTIKDDFWNTGLFLGLGYRNQNVTVGVRYNVLFNSDKNVYGDAFMPFVRAYF